MNSPSPNVNSSGDIVPRADTPPPAASIIIPTYNGCARIGRCLLALERQAQRYSVEILVVDDGSTDGTLQELTRHAGIRVLAQINAGPAAARNHGAREAKGKIILFTDDDCEPAADWLQSMLSPFNDPEVVAVKGAYRTRQRSLAARFVQAEYEDKYHYMSGFPRIDFVDTYSAAFVRERFMQMNGYDTDFPVACAEDIELSYRMSALGWKMIFAPQAIVYHQHPDSFPSYLKKKFKFAFWRVLAVQKNPAKSVKDSHTPQLMKVQLLLAPALACSLVIDTLLRPASRLTAVVLVAFLLSTLPFCLRTARRDPVLAMIAPGILAVRALAQFLGVVFGLLNARRASQRASLQAS